MHAIVVVHEWKHDEWLLGLLFEQEERICNAQLEACRQINEVWLVPQWKFRCRTDYSWYGGIIFSVILNQLKQLAPEIDSTCTLQVKTYWLCVTLGSFRIVWSEVFSSYIAMSRGDWLWKKYIYSKRQQQQHTQQQYCSLCWKLRDGAQSFVLISFSRCVEIT